MVSRFALFSNLLLASAALDFPSPRDGSTVQQATKLYNSSFQAGAVVNCTSLNGACTTVDGAFAIPDLTASSDCGDSGVSVYIGLDTDITSDCSYGVKVGVDAAVTDGVASYTAWFNFTNGVSGNLSANSTFSVNGGDVILISISATDIFFVNKASGERGGIAFGFYQPCGNDVEWMVSTINDSDLPLANFGSVLFTNANAGGNHTGIYNPLNATLLYEITEDQNATLRTSVTTGNHTLSVKDLLFD